MKTKKKKQVTVWEMAGFIKGGEPFDSVEETDRIAYGLEPKARQKKPKRRK